MIAKVMISLPYRPLKKYINIKKYVEDMPSVIIGFTILSTLITGLVLIPSPNQTFAQINSTGNSDFDNFFDDESTTDTASSNKTKSNTDSFVLKAQLKKNNKNQFIDDEFDVKKFGLVVSNESKLCPSNNCTFKYAHDEFNGFGLGGVTDRTLHGSLKITVDKKTKIFQVNSDLQVVGEEETSGNDTVELVEGNFDIGKDPYSPDYSYSVNGTLKWKGSNNAQLVLTGEAQE